jgi:putative lipoprotein (rSAM/lipoprotein system)
MYGVPTATYQISGKVVDSDGKPMSGLKVYPREVNMGGRDNSIFINVADTTDAEGNFNINRRITSLGDKDVNLIIEELDNDSKVVKSDTVKLELKNKTKRKGFDMGVFTAKKKKIKFSK